VSITELAAGPPGRSGAGMHDPSPTAPNRRVAPGLRWLLWLVLGLPLVGLAAGIFTGQLGANPVETLTHVTGEWALRCLVLSLSMTPLRRLTGWQWPPRLRRGLGLWAFAYACLHFTVWWLFDHQLDPITLLRDVLKRPWITVGFATLLVLLPLALTSTRGMVQRLGGRRWKGLHRGAYLAGVLGVLHFCWLVKADLAEPLVYAAILGAGFLVRRLPPRLPPKRVVTLS